MKKAAYYIRTSTAEQTPELQIRDLDTICQQPHDIYREQESAWADNVSRPVFTEVISLIKKGKLTDLYIWDLDRAYRNRKKLCEFFALCKTYGCKVHPYRQPWLEAINKIPAPFNEIVHDLLINLLGWIAEEESSKRSERVKLAVKRRADGTYSHNGNRWGRKALPKQTINRVLELYMQGLSVRQIAAQVNVYDKNNHGNSIGVTTVHRIITQFGKKER